MVYAKKIVLDCPTGYKPELAGLVEAFIRDNVAFVGVTGKDCSKIEDIIDEIVVGLGDRDYDLLTSSHPDKTLEDAIQFAKSLSITGDIQIIKL